MLLLLIILTRLSLEKENIIKDIRNIFKLKKELNYRAIKDIRNLFRLIQLQIEYLEIFGIFLRMRKKRKSVKVSNFCDNNYIEYESNGDSNKTLSVEKYLNLIRPHLKYIINNLKKSGT